ncbi:MAG TPA: multidrug transporter, partial [Caulobacteraceae bacterium]|nr:multidrug transporter [Caulobacteraceae bacterium]
MLRTISALALAATLGGCVQVPDLGVAPKAKPAASYATNQSLQAPPRDWPSDTWWAAYGDPQLDRLMTEALAGAPTLAQAQARLNRAQGDVQRAKGARAPQLDANAQVAEVKQS